LAGAGDPCRVQAIRIALTGTSERAASAAGAVVRNVTISGVAAPGMGASPS
jgi:hypothetical protein